MKSKVILLLAFIMASVTTVLFFHYMKSNNTSAPVTTISTVGVVVATDQIEKNEKIKAEKVKISQVEEKTVHPNAIRKLEDVIGQIATSTIIKGEQVLEQRLVSEKAETTYVSRKIKEGFRAVSVGVNINQSVTNLIEPEDEVDVIFSKRIKVKDKEQVVTKMLLKKVRVIAVGRKMVNPEDTTEPYVEYSSVTLELKPEDAVKIVHSEEEGLIHLILHQRPVEIKQK